MIRRRERCPSRQRHSALISRKPSPLRKRAPQGKGAKQLGLGGSAKGLPGTACRRAGGWPSLIVFVPQLEPTAAESEAAKFTSEPEAAVAKFTATEPEAMAKFAAAGPQAHVAQSNAETQRP